MIADLRDRALNQITPEEAAAIVRRLLPDAPTVERLTAAAFNSSI